MPASTGSTSTPLNLQGNGEKQDQPKQQSRRAVARELAAALTAAGHQVNPAQLRVLVKGYQSSADRDTRSISQWLEVRGFDPTARTAQHRADQDRGLAERLQRAHALRGGGLHG